MDENSLIVLVVIALIGFPVLAIVSFVMALNLKGRVRQLEESVRQLALARDGAAASRQAQPTGQTVQSVPQPADEKPDHQSEMAASPALGDTASPPEGPVDADPAADQPAEPVRQAARTGAPGKPSISFEEKLGTRWAVWVGGVALALGGAFLVRYAIEEDLLGPAARIIAGLIFSLGLIIAAEYLRRRPVEPAANQAAYIPGVITAAGTVALFATIYAAYGLYDFLTPAQAFVTLGLVGVATMYAAALHGPWLAGLGLVGAYGTPLLVSSNEPNPWALALFVIVVTAAAFLLARIRLWRWLAVAAIAAALLYGFVLVDLAGEDIASVVFFILSLAVLIGTVLIYEAHRGRAYQRFDPVGLGALAGLAVLSIYFADADGFSHTSLATLLIVAAIALASALWFDALAPAAVIAGLAVLACLLVWPIASQLASEPVQIIPGHLFIPFLVPDALETYLEIAIIPASAIFLATTASLMRRPRSEPPTFALALAGTATPIFTLAATYFRVENFQASLPFGAVAAGLALLFAATTERFLRFEPPTKAETASGVGSALHATASCSALALTLTFLIAGSPLTLAFGLSALGAAWVSTKRPLPALRWCAAGFILLVLARMGGAWMIAGVPFEHFPDWQDIVLRYTVPALAAFYAGMVLRRHKADLPAAILDCGALVLGAAAAALTVRLGVRGPMQATGSDIGLTEGGLYASIAFIASMVLVYRSWATTSLVYRAAAPIVTVIAVCLAVGMLLIIANPLLSGETIGGGAILNILLPGYALPALLAGLAAAFWHWYGRVPAGVDTAEARSMARPFETLCGVAGFVLGFFYVTFAVGKVVAGGTPDFFAAPAAENYGYTLAWLLYGLALLSLGIRARSRGIRLASAVAIMLAIAKAFLFDMSELEGIWRALSFMGLGAALIGIGLVYQRLLFGTRKPAKS